MNTLSLALASVFALSACATTGGGGASTDVRAGDRLALYRGNAGAPVAHIPFSSTIDNWTYLGESALAVWTTPRRAWLLELHGPCHELRFAHAIAFDSRGPQLSAGFDSVVVASRTAGPQIPCRINTIQPLDVAGIRKAERSGD